jgi:hypothetical protein
MSEIKRYNLAPCSAGILETANPDGSWCCWYDVEALQKELQEMTGKAVAAVWLIPEDIITDELRTLAQRARDVFSGEDQRTIVRLRDQVARLQDALEHALRPPQNGVTGVYGVRSDSDVRFALMITRLSRFENGGIEVEVRLP